MSSTTRYSRIADCESDVEPSSKESRTFSGAFQASTALWVVLVFVLFGVSFWGLSGVECPCAEQSARCETDILPVQQSLLPHSVFVPKPTVFQEDHDFVNMESLSNETLLREKLKYWKTILPAVGSGTIRLSSHIQHDLDLPTPYWVPIPDREKGKVHVTEDQKEFYMISVFHQLHCLSYLYAWIGGIRVTQADVSGSMGHVAHCVDYLRQGILCSGDTTIEGHTKYGEGWGSEHQCRDMDQLNAWAADHAGLEWHKFGDII